MAEKHGRVLIVDDDDSCRKINEIVMSEEGYETVLAENGLEAWELLQKEKFDLILLDRMMPIMSGDELAKKIRESNNNIPIIMLTALGFQQEREAGIKLGINQYISKAANDFEVELQMWSDNLIREFRKVKNQIKNEKEVTQTVLNKFKKISDQLNKIKISDFNNEKFISFEMAGASWEGDYPVLCQQLIEAIETLSFPNWPSLKPALLLKVNNQTIRINVEESSEDDQLLETAFNSFFIEEESSENDKISKVIWSVPWETREKGEGLSLLIYNLPRSSSEIDDGFGLHEESDREIVQGTTYRFLDYTAMVIGNFEIQRKFKDLVFSASVQLDSAINEIDANRQKQIEIFESAISNIEAIEYEENPSNHKKEVLDILNNHFDDFQQLEMNSLNDVQHLLKWIRKLKSQFSDLKDEDLTEEADAGQIGGSQEDVEKLLAQFDL